ncbi:MAG: DUF2283 domain-containing protein [bacterium]|nr:DUF2283 domain-containing protein [bacterium]
MYFSYDLQADALYVGFAPAIAAETHVIDEGTLVDVDDQGAIIGLEVINPTRQWPFDQICEKYSLTTEQRQLVEMLLPPQAEPVPETLWTSSTGSVAFHRHIGRSLARLQDA